jgi:hypothetical protein
MIRHHNDTFSHVGTTIAIERYYDDGITDYYAIVMGADGARASVYVSNPAQVQVDAPADVVAAYHAEIEAVRAAHAAKRAEEAARVAAEEAAREAALPLRGRSIVVVRGRKVAKGTAGIVFWYGETKFGWRVGFKTAGSDDPIWIDARNVEVVHDSAAAA